MEQILAAAAALAPFLAVLIQIVKPLLPQPANPAQQDSIVRIATVLVGELLSLAVYYFTAGTYSKAALGYAFAEGGVAALSATGLWHSAGVLLTSVRQTGTPPPGAMPTLPAFPPIAGDPLQKPN